MKFSPATGKLKCEFCGTESAIEDTMEEIEEFDFKSALAKLSDQPPELIEKTIVCSKCGSSFTLTPYSISSNCPYCGTPAITDFVQDITPQSLLPFQVTQKEAKERFKRWIGSLWFAPSAFTRYFNGKKKLQGYYLPYWTYDSDTITRYQGMRGDTYYVTVTRTVVRNGRQERIQVQEPRIRWTSASGTVSVSFDDVTIGASKTLSRAIIDSLGPWNTGGLKPFDEKYLSGFETEEYTIGLDNGFEFAKARMRSLIERSIRRDIGGDQQQIHSVDTRYHNVTFKNVLFPLWTASFKWKDKVYYYAINAQTGRIAGERPYSTVKIIFAVIVVALIIGGIMYYDQMQR
ncbi:MAG: primosomal protein N' (replication factor Y) - superfamily II helicase [Campylobacterota bacterium]|nr:primosomal protein N' (replication factor Y) - superfamily II helicase [Campylobacterota bacterium]